MRIPACALSPARLVASFLHRSQPRRYRCASVSDASGSTKVIVVGAGVIGLSVAVRLVEAGYLVTLVAEHTGAALVSHGAGGFWFPYLIEPEERASQWAIAAYHEFSRLAIEEPTAGVVMREVFLYDDLAERPPRPSWAPPGLRPMRPDEFPNVDGAASDVQPFRVTGGWRFLTPVVEMPKYLEYMRLRALRGGVVFVSAFLASLEDAAALGGDVVVNCAGLGNAPRRGLERDEAVYPIRGRTVRARTPALQAVHLAELRNGEFSAYAIPRGDFTVIGGTHESHEWDDTTNDDMVNDAMWVNATMMCPPGSFDGSVRGEAWSGLRPGRMGGVRLERDQRRGGDTCVYIHCYGHGGGGVTASHGCADEVLDLVRGVRSVSAT